ncbi:MAG: hypothetical protein AMS24_02385 [Chlamydiae bacterium SM23_39]|nr:MAG: hypothetical protein AMS24_02385 [Chlamydiae bacterium SM23_39]
MIDLDYLKRTTDKIFSLEELKEKLKSKKPLKIKYGVDVTAPFLHIGHAVNLWMMRHFQENGHKVIFLIGDFTTKIGDPTGKTKTRQIISKEDIEKNSKEFVRQVSKILITDKKVFEIKYNSDWFDKISLDKFLSLSSMLTYSKLIQRDMFQKRINKNLEIHMHEMLYPILQGYDSVVLESDLTIVGTDQLFNELIGRFYQEKFNQKPQVIITTRITPGTDGKEKQSKSLSNYIALDDNPKDKFGKVMSLPDYLILSYMEVYTKLPMEFIEDIRVSIKEKKINPMDAKKALARAIVERYHGSEIAEREESWFENAFSKRKTPEAIPKIDVSIDENLISILKKCMPDSSKSAIIRLIKQGGVRLNGEKVVFEALPKVNDKDILKIGKIRWFEIRLS